MIHSRCSPPIQFVWRYRGNYGQFGWYGQQPGDNEALISREAQTQRIVEATLQLFKKLE